MRVLMVNTPASTKFRGGDTTQMHKTAEALKELGVEVDISTDPEPDASGYDLAHVFNLRTIEATGRQIEALRRAGIPTSSNTSVTSPTTATRPTSPASAMPSPRPGRTTTRTRTNASC